MDVARWIGGGLCFLLGTWIILLNWVILVRRFRRPGRDGKHSSFSPLLGPVLVCLALLAVSEPLARECWWIPFVVDVGTGPLLAGSLVYFSVVWIRKRLIARS